jgi:glucan phosphoethanolaminetransferase (alkaline phosphatase superfamily)
MLTAYRIAYALVLVAFFGNVVMASKGQASAAASLLLVIAAVLLLSTLALLLPFSRIQPAVFWLLVLGWEALFVWYAWFSPAAPFVFHEAHVLDANAAASESTIHYLKAGALFAALFAWFLSLPLVRAAWKNRTSGV